MTIYRLFFWKLWQDKRGQDLVEYALMCMGFSMAIVALMPGLQPLFSEAFSRIVNVLVVAGAS